MAASDCSDFFNRTNYVGTWRGRADAHNITWDMFPEKTESTQYEENPDVVNLFNRDMLRYTGPDAPTYEYETKRDVTYGRDRLHMQEGGARTLTDPYADEDFDIQFHDPDPRGYLTEQPWHEYKHQMQSRFEQIDFKDDGDYSVPSEGIHPNQMYAQMRNTQNWIKARYKNFATSYENFHAGGVGMYDKMSMTYQSNLEDTTVRENKDWNDTTYNTPNALNISNYLHMGSKMWRVNSEPDQKVKIAAYGKLYGNNGLIPHETQLRLLENDTVLKKSKVAMPNKRLAKVMSDITSGTASEATRTMDVLFGRDTFVGKKERAAENTRLGMTRDIMALLGYSEQELKKIRQLETNNKSHAERMLATLHNMIEFVHKLPPAEKASLRNQLLLPAMRNNYLGEVDTKIKEQLQEMTKSSATREEGKVDSEQEMRIRKQLTTAPKTHKERQDPNVSRRRTVATTKDGTRRVANYTNVVKKTPPSNMSEQDAIMLQSLMQTQKSSAPHFARTDRGNLDNEFGENKSLDRKRGKLGTKYLANKIESDNVPTEMNDL